METLIITAIIGVAAIYTFRTFYKSMKNEEGGCAGGCASCGASGSCGEFQDSPDGDQIRPSGELITDATPSRHSRDSRKPQGNSVK
ncbi:hypothetical protein DENIS_0673 [Desulfonema ishimotonii]|uniref:FeoB-associated Cys-rich membrane protein n=1 Tax=Desulfonema ishimotonii TaxID=45657 RepID=A0A401FRY4_9BACT|nr:FeoB-associated Cys-rich membrane protein [Desulfonema ishimotonii]GBC59732.1 hypothetical protein DENIS_0673 [Desulfonema ishimotonii]